MSISSFVVRATGYEARVTSESLKASFADRRVRQYCNKTSTAPPVSTTAENIGTVNVNDRNGVSNLYPIIWPTIAHRVIKQHINAITIAENTAVFLKS